MARNQCPVAPADSNVEGVFTNIAGPLSYRWVAKAPPQELLDTLRKGVTMRNRLSHAGGASPSTEDVENILEAVRDLLWLTDYYSGVPWAFGHISDVTRAQLS